MTGAGRYVDFVAFDLMSCAMIDFYLLVVLYFVKSHILSILRDTYSRREIFFTAIQPPLLHVCGYTRLLAPGLRSSKFDTTSTKPPVTPASLHPTVPPSHPTQGIASDRLGIIGASCPKSGLPTPVLLSGHPGIRHRLKTRVWTPV